jgi:hypothetical protein
MPYVDYALEQWVLRCDTNVEREYRRKQEDFGTISEFCSSKQKNYSYNCKQIKTDKPLY